MSPRPKVRRIWQVDGRTLGIVWTSGLDARYDVVDLRRRCPCAVCVDEHTGRRILQPQDVSDAVRPELIRSVGAYALTIRFDDGHDTGIYDLGALHRLGQGSAN